MTSNTTDHLRPETEIKFSHHLLMLCEESCILGQVKLYLSADILKLLFPVVCCENVVLLVLLGFERNTTWLVSEKEHVLANLVSSPQIQ